MLINVLNISFIDILLHISYLFILSCFISYHISYTFHVAYTLLFVLVTVYYHHITMLCFSYHVIYYIHLIFVYLSFAFMFHACKYLRSGYGIELYVPEGTIILRDNDLNMYVPERTITV